MRVAELNMTNSSHQCPGGLEEREISVQRLCVRDGNSAGCSPVQFTAHNLIYSRVCGRITAYQAGTTEGFFGSNRTESDIDGNYVDGVSLSHGVPRQHIWTFAAASNELDTMYTCSCNNSNTAGTSPPQNMGNDYFCDTRSRDSEAKALWQGIDCAGSNACCTFNHPPWFYKQLLQPTSDDIEMRVCRDEDRSKSNTQRFTYNKATQT